MFEYHSTELWELLVPASSDDVKFSTKHHQEWDKKVCSVTSGLILQPKISGRYKGSAENSIPVRIACDRHQMSQIAKMTMEHYNQEAVMFYRISDNVTIITKS